MIENDDNNAVYIDLKQHIGHVITCEAIGNIREPETILLECQTCGEVIIEADCPEAE